MQRGDAWAAVADRLAESYPSILLDTPDEQPPRNAVAVGYSMGGRILLHRALDNARRWPALVLVGVSAGSDDPAARRDADEKLAAWIETHPIEEVVARWETNPLFATQATEVVAGQRAGRMSYDPSDLADLLRRFGQGVMPPVWRRLPELRVPVLLLAGARDQKYATAGERMAALLSNGVFRAIPEAGHAPQLENPDAVAAELRAFLDQRL
jgi:2-succinyl-6-hydroxy-2,4-cyclohexadiene-1-carboxylate synthase